MSKFSISAYQYMLRGLYLGCKVAALLGHVLKSWATHAQIWSSTTGLIIETLSIMIRHWNVIQCMVTLGLCLVSLCRNECNGRAAELSYVYINNERIITRTKDFCSDKWVGWYLPAQLQYDLISVHGSNGDLEDGSVQLHRQFRNVRKRVDKHQVHKKLRLTYVLEAILTPVHPRNSQTQRVRQGIA